MMSAGVIVPPRDYLPALECSATNMTSFSSSTRSLLVLAGLDASSRRSSSPLGRTSSCLARESQAGTRGFSATVITERLADAFWGPLGVEFAAGHTFAGNPFACAVGLAAFRRHWRGVSWRTPPNVASRASRGSAHSRKRCPRLAMSAARACSSVLILLRQATKMQFPASENVGLKVREFARNKGLLLRASHSMAVLAPPLTTTSQELDEMLDIFEEAVTGVVAPLHATWPPAKVQWIWPIGTKCLVIERPWKSSAATDSFEWTTRAFCGSMGGRRRSLPKNSGHLCT